MIDSINLDLVLFEKLPYITSYNNLQLHCTFFTLQIQFAYRLQSTDYYYSTTRMQHALTTQHATELGKRKNVTFVGTRTARKLTTFTLLLKISFIISQSRIILIVYPQR